MGNKITTDFLFARPSFSSGIARLFDFWGLYDLYNVSPSTVEADARAMYSDWRIVGQDLIIAKEQWQHEVRNDPRQKKLFSDAELHVGA